MTAHIDAVADRLTSLARSIPQPLQAPVAELMARPGKLLRPQLLLTCSRLGEPEQPDRPTRLAAIVELLHLASLLHDDVVDKASTRRGGPSGHTMVGSEQAMLAGLAVFALAGTEAATLGDQVSRAVSRTIAGVSYGEMLDVERAFDTGLPLDDYVELVQRKTGDLFRLSCQLGAAEAGLSKEQVRAADEFGSAYGIAFQIRDDCLEMEPERDPGKPTGTDHLLGLFGAPTLLALQVDGSEALARLLMAPDFGHGDMDAVRKHVHELGGVEAAQRLAVEWVGRGVTALGVLPESDARDTLAEFAAQLLAGKP